MSGRGLHHHRGDRLAPPPTLYDTAAIPALDHMAPPITIALPDGAQAQLPGALWPESAAWDASARRARLSGPPLEIRCLTRAESNVLVAAWHPLGAERRPFGYAAFGLFAHGEPIAVATSGSTVSASVEKSLGLDRRNTIELTRLCRHPDHPGCLRLILRAWRDYLAVRFWPYFPETEKRALVSYALPGKSGSSYRTDGWRRIRDCQPWAGGGTWSGPSRADHLPGRKALWIYSLTEGSPHGENLA